MDVNQPKILVVDDEEGIREVLMEALASMGYDSVGAESGFEALKILQGEPIDFVLCDKNMPRYSGFQLLADCNKLGILKPFVFLTGEESFECVVQGLRLGAVDFMLKPLDFDDLERVLKRVAALATLRKYEESVLESIDQHAGSNSGLVHRALVDQLARLRILS